MTTDNQQPPVVPERVTLTEVRRLRHQFDGMAHSSLINRLLNTIEHDARVQPVDDARVGDLAEGLTSQLFEVEGFGDYTNAQQREGVYDMVAETIRLALLPQLSSSEPRTIEGRGALATDHRDMEWVLEAPDGHLTESSERRCGECHHNNVDREGTCKERVSPLNYRDITYCSHKCVFSASAEPVAEQRDGYKEAQWCCTGCWQKRKCQVCESVTEWCCADCEIELGVPIYVCATKKCRDIHELRTCARNLRARIAELEAANGK